VGDTAGGCLLHHLVRGVEIGPSATIGEFRERLELEKLSLVVAGNDHLRKTEFVISGEAYRRAGTHIGGVGDAWDRTPDAGIGNAGAEDLDRDAGARGLDDYLYDVIRGRIGVGPGSEERRGRYDGGYGPSPCFVRGGLKVELLLWCH